MSAVTPSHSRAPILESISFEIVGHGWMVCTLRGDGEAVSVNASYLSDVLGDFVGMALAVATGAERASCFAVHREPEGSVIACLVGVNTAHLSVTASEDGVARTFQCSPVGLAAAIRDGVDAVDREAYRGEWPSHPFPGGQLDGLTRVLDVHRR